MENNRLGVGQLVPKNPHRLPSGDGDEQPQSGTVTVPVNDLVESRVVAADRMCEQSGDVKAIRGTCDHPYPVDAAGIRHEPILAAQWPMPA